MAYKPQQKTTKLVGKKSRALDPTTARRSSGTGKAPARNAAVAASVPRGGRKGLPPVPNRRVG